MSSYTLSSVWLSLPDATVLWQRGNHTIFLFPPGERHDHLATRPLDPVVAGLLTFPELNNHASFQSYTAYLARHIPKNDVTVTRSDDSFILQVLYRLTDPSGTVEIERKSWIDEANGFAPTRTTMRARSIDKGTWSSPTETTVQWKKVGTAFVPVSIVSTHSTRASTEKRLIEIAWSHINEAVGDRQFDLHYFHAPAGTTVVDHRLASTEPVIVETLGAPTPAELVTTRRAQATWRAYFWTADIAILAIIVTLLAWRRGRNRF